MIRGIMFFIGAWLVISALISIFWSSSIGNKVGVVKCMMYGFLTAAITSVLIAAIVYLF